MWTPDPSIIITAEQKQAEAQARLLETFRRAVQAHVDATAQTRDYDNGNSIAGYVASTNPIWASEAQAFVAWRDAVWAYAFAELAKVQHGAREIPTVEEFLAELPTINWNEGESK